MCVSRACTFLVELREECEGKSSNLAYKWSRRPVCSLFRSQLPSSSRIAYALHSSQFRLWIVCMTTILTAALVYWIEGKTGFSLYRFTFWIVIPAGSILCGVAGASGSFVSARVMNSRPGTHPGVLAAADSLLMFLALSWMEYSFAVAHGVHLSQQIPFATYLSYVLSHGKMAELSQRRSGRQAWLVRWRWLLHGCATYVEPHFRVIVRTIPMLLRNVQESQ